LFLLGSFVIMVCAVSHDISYLVRSQLPFAWLTTYGYFGIVITAFALLAQEQALNYHKSIQSGVDLLIDRNRIRALNEEIIKQKDSFFRFVPTQFLELLGHKSVVDIKAGDSSLRKLTVLFSDIRNFTTISEGLMPIEIFEFLNSYLSRMENAVLRNNGFVDKYIGDAIMALYSSENDTENSCADNALRSVLMINIELSEFNRFIISKGFSSVNIGIGINTGEVTLGTVGSENRLDTTVIGDAVNLASRLETLTKLYRTRNLVSEYTINNIKSSGEFHFRMVDYLSVPGRKAPLRVYELLDPVIDRLKYEQSDEFKIAQTHYQNMNFDAAMNCFRKISHENPDDNLPLLYMQRCSELMQYIPDNWDGVYRIDSKDNTGIKI